MQPGVIDMQRGHKLTHPPALELPDCFDPSGVPCVDAGKTRSRTGSSHRRHPRRLPGLHPTAVIASVEAVAEEGDRDWLVWGNVDDRPVLFTVDGGAAAEMLDSVRTGEIATAIVEPWQLMLERLD
jgi:hypothetical protein